MRNPCRRFERPFLDLILFKYLQAVALGLFGQGGVIYLNSRHWSCQQRMLVEASWVSLKIPRWNLQVYSLVAQLVILQAVSETSQVRQASAH